ncbi:HAD family hydrolase [Acidicapsa acidisoli]|uniref:HAD family hydrolase n=1 Tax=Acidicapsa acidisoli TaxID=1615681 RepID=UPI0021E0430A|nr:HAD family hydrolase [Acidicapsa acidisoli]
MADNKFTTMNANQPSTNLPTATEALPYTYDRAAAWALLIEWTQSESLRKHALGVETCVLAYGEAEADRIDLTESAREEFLTLYATTALLHDFDYERHPSLEEHPFVGVRELARLGWPQATQTAILGHATYSGVPRETHMDKVLFACDELSGFLTACALVKPSKAIADVEPSSVRKKLKDKAFARGVNRQDVIQGAEELGVDLDAHIAFCLAAMQRRASELSL